MALDRTSRTDIQSKLLHTSRRIQLAAEYRPSQCLIYNYRVYMSISAYYIRANQACVGECQTKCSSEVRNTSFLITNIFITNLKICIWLNLKYIWQKCTMYKNIWDFFSFKFLFHGKILLYFLNLKYKYVTNRYLLYI